MGCTQNVHIDCPSKNEEKTGGVHTEKRKRSVGSLNSTDDVCGTWKKNNAKQYGDDVASFASQVNVTVNERGITGSEEDGSYIYRSGSPLSISLEVRDGFDQGPAVGRNGRVVSSTISSPNSLFSGYQTILLGSPSTELNVTGFAKPGNYTVLINFDEDILKEEEINVTVQNCTIGEASLRNGTLCEPCNAATYNVDVDDEESECRPCPDNGNCTTKVIVPKQGYWHSSPCSPHIQRCLTTHACDCKNRTATLQEKSENMDNCNISNKEIEEYQQEQCEKASLIF